MTNPANYRYRDLKPGDAYYEAWRKFNRKQISPFWAFLGFLPFSIAMFVMFERVGLSDDWAMLPIVCYGIGYIVFGLWSLRVRCPRCKNQYLGPVLKRKGLYSATRNECYYCDLPRWAPDDPDKDAGDD